MDTFQDKIPHLPIIIPLSLLPHPPGMVRRPNLLQNTLPGSQVYPVARLCPTAPRARVRVTQAFLDLELGHLWHLFLREPIRALWLAVRATSVEPREAIARPVLLQTSHVAFEADR